MIYPVFPFLFRGSLPSKKELLQINSLSQVIDLTNRERILIKKTCLLNNIRYYKQPLNEYTINKEKIFTILQLITAKEITLVHCWGGRHRTGLICALIQHQRGVPAQKILSDLFFYGFGDPQKHLSYFDFILKTIC